MAPSTMLAGQEEEKEEEDMEGDGDVGGVGEGRGPLLRNSKMCLLSSGLGCLGSGHNVEVSVYL